MVEYKRNIIAIIIHGVQTSDSFNDNYLSKSQNFIKGVRKFISKESKNNVIFVPFNWNVDVQDRQMIAYESMEDGLGRKKLRKLKHTLGSDIMWWGRTKARNGFYEKTMKKLDALIKKYLQLYGPDSVIVGIGHSQGSQIFYEYMFESNYADRIEGFISMGSPIGAYSGMYPEWGRLAPYLKWWVNLYNSNDFISTNFQYHPNPKISNFVDNYRIKSWNPLDSFPYILGAVRSHTLYWRSKKSFEVVGAALDYAQKNIETDPLTNT